MKVLLYGEPLSPGCGSWSYATTLQKLGHTVEHCDSWEGLEKYAESFLHRVYKRLSGGIAERDRRRHVARLLEHAERYRPDLVIVLKGLHIAKADIEQMQRGGAFVVIINHDDFFSLNPSNVTRVQRAALPAWDYVFVCREANVGEVREFNPNVEFLWFGYNPEVHYPVPVDPTSEEDRVWRSDVAFVGTWEKERADLIEYLAERVDADFAIWGSQWEKLPSNSVLRKHLRGNEVYMDDQCRALGGAKISLGFLRKMNRDLFTTRTFEIPACGGLLLGERTTLHEAIFREGVEAEYFDVNDPDEMVAKVKALLADDERRKRIRDAGMLALEQGKHRYQDRVEQVLARVQPRSQAEVEGV